MTGVLRIWLRRLATGLAATGALLLLLAPFLPLAEDAPRTGLQNTLFWRPPPLDWIVLLVAALLVPVALALWDASSGMRLAGPVLLIAAGIGAALLASWLRAGDLLNPCNWLNHRTLAGCRPVRYYDEAQALGAAMLGGTLLVLAGLLLPLGRRYSPAHSEHRRRRLRSLSYM